jgi:threonine dehydratase
MLTIDKVRRAQETLSGVARKTDIILASNLTDTCGLWLKTENLQRTGSFKLRGAYYKMSLFSDEEKGRGVVACSGQSRAGRGFGRAAVRHQGDDLSAKRRAAFQNRSDGRYGAQIVLVDGVYDDAYTGPSNTPKRRARRFCTRLTTKTSSQARRRSAWRY